VTGVPQEEAEAEEGLHHREGAEAAGEAVVAWWLGAPAAEPRQSRFGGRQIEE
jgi:hypothetical protein